MPNTGTHRMYIKEAPRIIYSEQSPPTSRLGEWERGGDECLPLAVPGSRTEPRNESRRGFFFILHFCLVILQEEEEEEENTPPPRSP